MNGIEKGIKINKKELRANFVNNENYKEDNKWVLDTPYDIRDEAMNDSIKAYKTNFAKEKHKFKIKFKSKKQSSDSIAILSKHWRKAGVFFPTFFGKDPIHSSELLPDKLEYDSRLQRTRMGEFYLCIPKPLEIRDENQAPNYTRKERGIIALDPGVRTFMTGYSPAGHAIECGVGDITRIYRLCHALDRLQSKWSKKEVKHKNRYKMQQAGRRIRKKIRSLIDEFHCKLVKFLVTHYHTILLPKFETQQMIQTSKRRIGSRTARAMMTWSHYRFQQRLLFKIKEFPWCNVIIVDEDYTSKTCGNCGQLNESLGSSKTFHCSKCHYVADRDIQAARNILLRFLTLRAIPLGDMALRLHSKIDSEWGQLSHDQVDLCEYSDSRAELG